MKMRRPMTDLVLEGAQIKAAGDFPVLANQNLRENDKHSWSFQDEFITIRGNGQFDGDVMLYNCFQVNINGPEFTGVLRFAYTREVRLYNCNFTGEHAVVMTMGCNNYIMQNLTATCAGSAVVMDGSSV